MKNRMNEKNMIVRAAVLSLLEATFVRSGVFLCR